MVAADDPEQAEALQRAPFKAFAIGDRIMGKRLSQESSAPLDK